MENKTTEKQRAFVMKALNDLTEKAVADVHRAISTPMDLAGEIAGSTGIFGIVQKLSSVLMSGASICFAGMRDNNKTDNHNDDDLLWVVLMAYEAEKSNAYASTEGFVERVQENFMKIRGYPHKIPDWWQRPN